MSESIIPATQNGQYQITESEEGVYLCVYAPSKGGSLIEEGAIIQELIDRKIVTFEMDIISTTIREASGQEIMIAGPPPVMPDIRVMVRRDRLEVMVDITTPPHAQRVTKLQLRDKLQAAGVVYGIDDHAIDWLVKARSGLNVICARASLPHDGACAFQKYHVDIESQGRPVELEDGSVDFKNINSFLSVTAGQLLVEKIPPTPGTPGRDVLGLPIRPKPGRDIRMSAGKNVTLVDGCRLVANIDGQLHIHRRRIDVIPTIEVAGDVDYSTGNIDFVGNVVVRGSVQCGFSVKAGGNVEIRGTICGGMVEANNIIVHMGIQGMNRSVIKSRDRLVAKFIENATVYADHEVVVSDVVMNSFIFAGARVIVEGKRGIVIGGRIAAGESIRVRTVGNQSHIVTDLEVGADPFLKDELQNLRNENKQVDAALEELSLSLAYISNQGLENLNTEKRERYDKMEADYNTLLERGEEIRQRRIDIEALIYSLKPGKIHVVGVLYPGVKVSIGPLVKIINDSLQYLSLYAHEGEIKFSSFRCHGE